MPKKDQADQKVTKLPARSKFNTLLRMTKKKLQIKRINKKR